MVELYCNVSFNEYREGKIYLVDWDETPVFWEGVVAGGYMTRNTIDDALADQGVDDGSVVVGPGVLLGAVRRPRLARRLGSQGVDPVDVPQEVDDGAGESEQDGDPAGVAAGGIHESVQNDV